MMLFLRIPSELEARLSLLAKKTGRTKSFYAIKALSENLEALEDYYISEAEYQEFLASGQKTISLDDAMGIL